MTVLCLMISDGKSTSQGVPHAEKDFEDGVVDKVDSAFEANRAVALCRWKHMDTRNRFFMYYQVNNTLPIHSLSYRNIHCRY